MRRLVRLPATVTLRAIIAAFGRLAIFLLSDPDFIGFGLHPAGPMSSYSIEYAYR
jgi:hypothetical protein